MSPDVPQSSQAASQICCQKPSVADDFCDFAFAIKFLIKKSMADYTTKTQFGVKKTVSPKKNALPVLEKGAWFDYRLSLYNNKLPQ